MDRHLGGFEWEGVVLERNPARHFMWTVKLALVACLLVGLVFDPSQLDGKAWVARSIAYPLAAVVVPAIWWASGRRGAYPWLGDGLFVAPFVLDLAGNLFGLFDAFQHFDDVLHFVNWALLAAAFVAFTAPVGLARWNRAALGAGFGAIAIILWEFVEYAIQEAGTTGLELTYEDTISDLMLSTIGGFLGAATMAWFIDR